MTCESVKLPGGQLAIVCHRGGRPKWCRCGARATRLCDFETKPAIGRAKAVTCDAPLCPSCAVHVAPNEDFCPTHPEPANAQLGLGL